MKSIWYKIRNIKRNTLIKNSFLLPILSVVAISISHVISWYDIGNPIAWAIYLSIAIEIFALASVSAASIKMKRGSIWFLFGMVTIIQIVGNIFFTYKEIDIAGEAFLSWMELIQPIASDWDVIDHKRFLAYIQGGTLPFMSLVALHFYIKFEDNISKAQEETEIEEPETEEAEEPETEGEEVIEETETEEETEEPETEGEEVIEETETEEETEETEEPETEDEEVTEEPETEEETKEAEETKETEEPEIEEETKEAEETKETETEEAEVEMIDKIDDDIIVNKVEHSIVNAPESKHVNPQVLPGIN